MPAILLALGVAYLLLKGDLGSLANFAPAMAFAFTGAVVMPERYRFWAPLAMVFLSDLLLATAGGFGAAFILNGGIIVKYLALGAAAFWGSRLKNASVLGILGRVTACSIGFYFVSNTFAWLTLPGYPMNLAGWVQANWTGLPGYLPSWMFLRNALASDLIFSVILLVAFNWEASSKRVRTFAWLPEARYAGS